MRTTTKLLATDAPLGIGPSDVQPPSERERRIAEVFLERHAAAVIEAIDAGRLGDEWKRQWRRWLTNGDRHWPWTEKRKKRKP